MKAPPLKDVAGMLRSFDYARGVTARTVGAERQIDRAELEAILADWREQTRTAFLDAYRDALGGSRAYPDDPRDVAALIELAYIEKLLYEIRYELRNRPDWLALPWGDLAALFGS